MSQDVAVAKRYARALFEVAEQKQSVRAVEADLRLIVEAIENNPELNKLLGHPSVDRSAKMALFNKVFAGNVSEVTLHTLELLFRKGRETLLAALLQAYVIIANNASGQVDAIVYVPAALSEPEKNEVAAHFGKLTGKTIRLEQVVNPDLLGGLQVRIGDRLYDGSLSGKLARLNRALTQTQAL